MYQVAEKLVSCHAGATARKKKKKSKENISWINN